VLRLNRQIQIRHAGKWKTGFNADEGERVDEAIRHAAGSGGVRASAQDLPNRIRRCTWSREGAVRWKRAMAARGKRAARMCACDEDKTWQLVEAGAQQALPPRQRTGRQCRL
jgi:hypothetical protein